MFGGGGFTYIHKHSRKFRQRPRKKKRNRAREVNIEDELRLMLNNSAHKSTDFISRLRTYIVSLPANRMTVLTNKADELLLAQGVAKYIPLIVKDLSRFRMNEHTAKNVERTPERPEDICG